MLVESIAIVMILIFIVVIFLRAHRKDYAMASLPFLLVPLAHALIMILGEFFRFANTPLFRAGGDVLALAVSIAMTAIFSTQVKSRRSRYVYLCLCGVFSVALTLIFIYQIYLPA